MRKDKSFFRKTQFYNFGTAKIVCLSLLLAGSSQSYANEFPIKNEVSSVQQQQVVHGVVLDETGEPIIGANVKVVGTTSGTISDMDGKFSLNAPTGSKVEISFIGYQTQVITVQGRTNLKVVMREDSKLLDEVVIVGYGTQDRKSVV